MAKTYREKLSDPRWQRRRLEILSANDFACENCGDKKKTLHVHHRSYRRGANPWDYKDSELACVCDGCHESYEAAREVLENSIAQMGLAQLCMLAGFAVGLSSDEHDADGNRSDMMPELRMLEAVHEGVEGFARACVSHIGPIGGATELIVKLSMAANKTTVHDMSRGAPVLGDG